LITRSWPLQTAVRVISVAHPTPLVTDPFMVLTAAHVESLKEEHLRASGDVAKVADEIAKKAPGLQVSTQVLEGSPKKMIVEEAEHWGADLIIVGSHGHGPAERFLLGSVAQAVALHAPCSVEIVRSQRSTGT
ncbi:MAG TPA: universal stress protein, partial [Candidatus Acidoferrales bacterium]|nr:universal stress protein [Candidatus Acidoferrales bacterium]